MMRVAARPGKPVATELFGGRRVGPSQSFPGGGHGDTTEQGTAIASQGAWAKAELLARRLYELATMPMRSENHPTWDPTWRKAMEAAFVAIGTGDGKSKDEALVRLEQLARNHA